MDQNIKLSYDQMIEGFRPKDGSWADACPCFLGLIEGVAERGDLPPRERVARVRYVLARFRELREEEARKWKH